MEQFDLIIIGGGPGGYVAAIRASQLGMKTALVEKGATLGGTCTNVGCIPTKALLESSERYEEALHSLAGHGVLVDSVRLDLPTMMERKEKVVGELTKGLEFLMKKNKIRVFRGIGRLESARQGEIVVRVEGEESLTLSGTKGILAPGSVPQVIPGMEYDGERILSSDDAIALREVPEHLLIVGAGVIGLELGSVWKRLGAKVTLVEMMPEILPGLERQVRDMARRSLSSGGLEILTAHTVERVEKSDATVTLTVKDAKGETREIRGDRLLVAAGRKPATENLGLEKAGVERDEKGRIKVDDATLETSVPGLYAIGDAIRGPMLAHKAEEEGVFVAERMAGHAASVNYHTIPSVVYTWPEIAWVGESDASLKEKGVDYKEGKFLFRVNGRAKAMDATDGVVKILAHRETDKILGVHILGAGASELIAEAVVAMEFSASSEDLARTVHAHPTLSETVKEAALNTLGRSIHA